MAELPAFGAGNFGVTGALCVHAAMLVANQTLNKTRLNRLALRTMATALRL
jgi:hypothetical protein